MAEANVSGLLQSAKDIQERIDRDQLVLVQIQATIQKQIRAGRTSGDHILDIVLHFGFPYQMGNMEKHLHTIDEQVRTCAGQFIVTELIGYNRIDHSAPKAHRTIAGVLTTDSPTMHYVDEEGIFRGVVIPTKSPPRILIDDLFLKELINGDKPFWGLLNSSLHYSFELAIGYDAVWKFLSPERQSFTETPETRQVRMQRLARRLNDLMTNHGIFIDGHRPMQNYIRDAAYP